MYALLLASLAGVEVAQEGKAAAPKLDGKWLIVYSEEGGRRNTAWEAKVATLSDNKLSYEGEKKAKLSVDLSFGPQQTVRATISRDDDKAKGAYHGVYIAARDYLCLSLNPGKGDDKKGPAAQAKGEPSSAALIMILRRQREK